MSPLQDFPVLKARGPVLLIEDYQDPIIRQHVADLARVPEMLLARIVAAGLLQIHLAARSVPLLDALQHLQGVHPRGWWPRATWDIVPGAYVAANRAIVAGIGRHASNSLMLHEFGHALGDLLGYDNDIRLRDAHIRLYPPLNPYLQQGGPGALAGCQELLAEGFADLLIDRDEALRLYDTSFVQYLETVVLSGQSVP